MWIRIIKHFNWQLFTITDKGIPGPGNSQIAKASYGELTASPITPQLQSRVFRYAQDAPKCPKLNSNGGIPQFLDYPLMVIIR